MRTPPPAGSLSAAAARRAMVLESLIEPLILNSAKKYIANLDISALRLSIFGGDVVLQNLELKLEVLRQEFAAGLPIHFRRGFVRELRIRIPWLRLASEPIQIVVDAVELVASLAEDDDDADDDADADGDAAEPATSPAPQTAAKASDSPDPQAGDSWMQSLVLKALFNAGLTVTNVVIKLEAAKAVASVSLRRLELASAAAAWEPAFIEPEGPSALLRKRLHVAELTVCLDPSEADGRAARFLQPLVRRASVEARLGRAKGGVGDAGLPHARFVDAGEGGEARRERAQRAACQRLRQRHEARRRVRREDGEDARLFGRRGRRRVEPARGGAQQRLHAVRRVRRREVDAHAVGRDREVARLADQRAQHRALVDEVDRVQVGVGAVAGDDARRVDARARRRRRVLAAARVLDVEVRLHAAHDGVADEDRRRTRVVEVLAQLEALLEGAADGEEAARGLHA